jgi:thiosulfate reductase / polysulfide reductase chain A
MTAKSVYSVCGMCTVRCPIKVTVEDGQVTFLQGNPHVPAMKGAVCPRGAAGNALITDHERPQSPMIRSGARGEGKWRKVSWDEAFDYVADKLKEIKDKHGAKAISLTDRGGPFRDMHRALLRGLGSPNYCNHDSSCARNVQHASMSITGMGRKGYAYDLKNAKHVVLQLRNIFEAINVQEVNNLMDAMENGCKLTVIDIRATVTASKATRYFQVRPGSDYAFNLAVIHELLKKRLYDEKYAARYIEGLRELEHFIEPYSPEWAEGETGINPDSLRQFARELAAAKGAVIWHPGWMAARYRDSFYVCRTAYIINALLGSFGAKGGMPFVSKPTDLGRNDLKAFVDLYPKPTDKRADGLGWRYTHFEEGPGLAHLMYEAMESNDPYPVKAYIAYRHDPLMGFPDPERLKAIFSNLDLLVAVTFSWSDTAWFADVVLPLSPYLERESVIATKNALKPQFFVRHRAIEPRYDTKADWEIVGGLAKRLGLPELVFDKVEDIWRFQLDGTGVGIRGVRQERHGQPQRQADLQGHQQPQVQDGQRQNRDHLAQADQGRPALAQGLRTAADSTGGHLPPHLRPLRRPHPGTYRQQPAAVRAGADQPLVDQRRGRRQARYRQAATRWWCPRATMRKPRWPRSPSSFTPRRSSSSMVSATACRWRAAPSAGVSPIRISCAAV